MNYLDLDEVKLIEKRILIEFDNYCREHNLRYFLTYGTLLGAVRNKGFIPWDDDIDVMMPRKDYNDFIKLLSGKDDIEGCELYTRAKAGYYYPFAKLCDKGTVANMEDNKMQHGLWLDIFPIDAVPSNPNKLKRFHKRFILYRAFILSYATRFDQLKICPKTLIKLLFSIITKIIGINRFLDMVERNVCKYNESNTGNYSAVCWQNALGGDLSDEDITSPVEIEFEGHMFYVPKNYDRYLSSLYGDYMIPLSEDKRKSHFMKAYYK